MVISRKKSVSISPWVLISVCWLGVFVLSCSLSYEAAARTTGEHGLATAFFSGSRQAFSSQLAENADMYFHRGVPQVRDKAFKDRFFQKLERELSPDGHVHLQGGGVKETLPWYWLAIKMDPHNIQNYLVAAYWLSKSVNDFERAHAVLQEARINTALNHAIETEDAILYMKENKIANASKTLDTALNIWPSGEDPSNKDIMIDKLHIHMFKALICESTGELDEAITHLESILQITPGDKDLEIHIDNLRKGINPSLLAKNRLDAMLNSRGNADDCHREQEDSPTCGPDGNHENH